MDADSIAIIVSFLGLLGTPLWGKLSARLVIGEGAATPLRITGVVLVSLLVMTAVFVGPWIAMMSWHGLFAKNSLIQT